MTGHNGSTTRVTAEELRVLRSVFGHVEVTDDMKISRANQVGRNVDNALEVVRARVVAAAVQAVVDKLRSLPPGAKVSVQHVAAALEAALAAERPVLVEEAR